MDAPDESAQSDLIDLGRLISAVVGRLRTILAVGLAACVAAIAFVFLVTPQFAGQSQVLLESRDSVYTRTLGQGEAQAGVFDEQAVQSQVQIVTSREVAREAIRRLGLVGHPDFDPLAGPGSPVARIRAMLGLASGAFDGREEDRIFDAYYEALTVYPVPRSRVVAVEFRASDPELAARAANVIAEIYLEQLEAAKGELARAASDWLGANIDELRERVAQAERAVEDFRARSRLFVGGGNATISAQQLGDLNARLTEARSAQADAEARAQLIADMIRDGRAFEIPDVANNELIRRLIEQRIDLRSQIALEQRTLLPAHPRILELRAQLADLDAQIVSSAERTVRVLENDARIAGSRVEALEAALEAQMRVAAEANESEVQLRALEREARAEREQLEAYLVRYREALARGTDNASLPDARIVSRAVAPNAPVYPRKGPTVVLATLGAIFMAVGFVVVGELAFGGPPGGGRRRRAEETEAFEDAASPEPAPRPDARRDALREAARRDGAQAEPRFEEPSSPEPQRPARDLRTVALDIGAIGARLRGTLSPEPFAEVAARSAPGSLPVSAAMPGEGDDPRAEEVARAEAVRDAIALTEPARIEAPQDKAPQDKAPQENRLQDAFPQPDFLRDEPLQDEPLQDEPLQDEPLQDEPLQYEPPRDEPSRDDRPQLDQPRDEPRAVARGDEAVADEAAPDRAERRAALPDQPIPTAGEEDDYDFDGLIARLAAASGDSRKMRVLVTGLGDPESLRDFARAFAEAASAGRRAALVEGQPDPRARPAKGFSDLVAGEASFFEVIRRSRGSDLHRIGYGSGDGPGLAADEEALDIALSALAHTYECLTLSLPDPSDLDRLALLARRVDAVVIASDRDLSDPELVDLHDRLVGAGGAEVLVAAVGAVAAAAAA